MMKRAFVAALLLAFSANAAGPESEIGALLTEFLARVDDPAMHARFWADDLVYVSAKGVVRTKAMILQSMGEKKPDDAKVSYGAEEVKVRALAKDVAVLNFRLVQHDGDKTNHFRNSGTFAKRKGKWQVVSWQATREEEAAENK